MKTMARQIGTVLCMALALLSAFYAFAVMKTHSGTGFWKVWLVIAAVFALLAVGIAANWWVALPRIIRGVIIAVVCIGIAIFGTVEGCIISNMHARGDQHLDYVVVLGAQVRKSGPSKALRYRLTRRPIICGTVRIPSASSPAARARTSHSPRHRAWPII